MSDRESRLQQVKNNIGQRVIKRRSGCAYELASYDEETERVTLIPLHKGGRTTRRWFMNLFIDYRLENKA